MAPTNGGGGAKGGLENIAVGRRGGDAAKVDVAQREAVSGTEEAADVVGRADVVEDEGEGKLLGGGELRRGKTLEVS